VQYRGFTFPVPEDVASSGLEQNLWETQRLDRSAPDLQKSFDAFVARREPVAIKYWSATVSDVCNGADEASVLLDNLRDRILVPEEMGNLTWSGLLNAAGDAIVSFEVASAGHLLGWGPGTIKIQGELAAVLAVVVKGKISADSADEAAAHIYVNIGAPEPGSIWGPPLNRVQKNAPGALSVPKLLSKHYNVDEVNFWVGSCSSDFTSRVHTDKSDNLYMVLAGQKRIRLLDPTQNEVAETCSPVTQVHPNGEVQHWGSYEAAKFGAKRLSARHNEVVLSAGDAVLIPAGFAHEVSSVCGEEPLHAAVNVWFSDTKQAQ